jgi:DNA-binding phage protein
MKRKRRVPQSDFLTESLKDHDSAVAYLKAAIEESFKGPGSQLLTHALLDVAKAQEWKIRRD